MKRFADHNARILSAYDTSSRGTRHLSDRHLCARPTLGLELVAAKKGGRAEYTIT